MSDISLITLTRVVDHKYFSDSPDFPRDVWPLVLAHQESIRGLHIVVDRTANSFALRTLGVPLWDRTPSVCAYTLPSLSDLAQEQLEAVKYSSSSDGHLTILYVTDCESDLSRALVNLWPTATFQTTCDWEGLGLESQTLSTFAKIVENCINCSCVVSFAHEADPLYIFGREERLRILLNDRDLNMLHT